MIPSMSGFELGWVVGFLEGEGSFINPNRHKGTGIRAQAKQVQREPLERMLRYTGIGRIKGPYVRGKNPLPQHSPVYTWLVGGPEGYEFVRMIRPFMSPKRQVQIDTALTSYHNPPNPKETEAKRRSRATRKKNEDSEKAQLRLLERDAS